MINDPSCLIIAGEKSGEDLALSFYSDLKTSFPKYSFFGVGGDELQSLGMDILYHWRDFSSMGFSEVITKLPFYFKAKRRLLDEVKKRNTKKAILIDFQDFNLRLALSLKKLGVEVYYVVAPQAWAWRENRATLLGKNINTLFCILPFEKKWFKDRGVRNTIALPHPLSHELARFKEQILARSTANWKLEKICLLPGSRRAEIAIQLPVFVEVIKELRKTNPELKVTLVKASGVNSPYFELYQKYFDYVSDSKLLTHTLLESDLALATSGTVTLSCGLTATPTIVCYKTNLFNEFIFNQFINYKGFISLTNLILGEAVFPELKQDSVEAKKIIGLINEWNTKPTIVTEKISKLKTLIELLKGDMPTPFPYLKSEF